MGIDGGREREWGGGGKGQKKGGRRGDRKWQDGYSRMETGHIHQAVCVRVSGKSAIFYFLYGQNTPRRTEKMKKSRKMPLLHRKRLMTEVSNNKTHLCGSVWDRIRQLGEWKMHHLQSHTHTATHRWKVRTLRDTQTQWWTKWEDK